MKRVVSLDEIQAAEISPDLIYQEYTQYLQEDIQRSFNSPNFLVETGCPGCGQIQNRAAFKIIGLQYRVCDQCMSWYVSPRPSVERLRDFYHNSKACQYWRKQILNFSEPHWLHIHAPRIHWILDLIDEYLPTSCRVFDFQSKYPIFLSKLAEEKSIESVISIDSFLFEQLPKSSKIQADTLESDRDQVDLLLAFEALERMADINQFFQFAAKKCRSGSLLLITTATCSGFEYQVLGENAPNLNPINRMNLLSIEALTKRVEDIGFEILELSTPGRLDVQIVQKAVKENSNLKLDRFWNYILTKRDEKAWLSLQEFLQLNRLSSHVRIAAKKK